MIINIFCGMYCSCYFNIKVVQQWVNLISCCFSYCTFALQDLELINKGYGSQDFSGNSGILALATFFGTSMVRLSWVSSYLIPSGILILPVIGYKLTKQVHEVLKYIPGVTGLLSDSAIAARVVQGSHYSRLWFQVPLFFRFGNFVILEVVLENSVK